MEHNLQINDVIQITKSNNKLLENKEFVIDKVEQNDEVVLIDVKDLTKHDVPIYSKERLGNKDDPIEYRFIARGENEKTKKYAETIREKAIKDNDEPKPTSEKERPQRATVHVNETDMRKKATISWQIIERYFRDNPHNLVAHHLQSVNHFYKHDIPRIFREHNPVRFVTSQMQSKKRQEFLLYFGGKEGDRIFYGKPLVYDDNEFHYLFPNEARLRNMTYGVTIHYDVDIEIIMDEKHTEMHLQKILLGRFPIMVQSDLCILSGLNKEVRFNAGECRNDVGGYFIIDGQETVVLPQEKLADNTLFLRVLRDNPYSHSANIRSVSENISKPVSTIAVRIVAPTKKLTNNHLVVFIPHLKAPIPLFVLMRALGVISDHDIMQTCILGHTSMIDLLIPCVHNAHKIFNQQNALEYIAELTERGTINNVLEILSDHFLPHIGEVNFIDKAYFLGYMVYRLLRVFTKQDQPTDQHYMGNKRIHLPGDLMRNLFQECYLRQRREIERALLRMQVDPDTGLLLIDAALFNQDTIAKGFQHAFQTNHRKALPIETLERSNWYATISHLRQIQVPASPDDMQPRLLQTSEWGYIDPIDTPHNEHIGLQKHLAIMAHITLPGLTNQIILAWFQKHALYKHMTECRPHEIAHNCKVFVNGVWLGVTNNPFEVVDLLKLHRRNGLLPNNINGSFDIARNEIHVCIDAGRLVRPLFYIENQKVSYDRKDVREKLSRGQLSWEQIVSGLQEEPDGKQKQTEKTELRSHQSIIDYVDTAEQATALIATQVEDLATSKFYTHLEVDPSLMFGIMGNLVVYPEHNPLRQNVFSCSQTRQAISMCHSNHAMRMDERDSVILSYGQTPLIKSRYLELVNQEEQPYGVNVLVAIMTYTGYNADNAILVNESAVQRGLFASTRYSMYQGKEESIDSLLMNIEENNVLHKKKGFDYGHLDGNGLVRMDSPVHDKLILIGKGRRSKQMYFDESIRPKKGETGVVDKRFVSLNEQNLNLAKVRIRDHRVLAMGDNLANRTGKQGVVSLVVPEESMPFMADGVRPDIIINPHSIPSSMNVSQLIESMFGIVCTAYGAFGDCTAFQVKGSNYSVYGPLLTKAGFHHTGNHVLYNGMTGEQIQADIFAGPTYYMRLKQMIQDRVVHRASGPKDVLTRQSNDKLCISEMDRDALCAHGLAYFLNESFMGRGDAYYLAVCNKTGAIAVYNSTNNVFLSPFADGPIGFHTTPTGEMNVKMTTRYGRSFSLLRVPYAFKLLIQELQVMNIQMRLVTDANADQFMSMTFSNNISNLLQIPSAKNTEELKQVVVSYVETISKSVQPASKRDNRKSKPVHHPQEKEKEETESFVITEVKEVSPEQEIIVVEEVEQPNIVFVPPSPSPSSSSSPSPSLSPETNNAETKTIKISILDVEPEKVIEEKETNTKSNEEQSEKQETNETKKIVNFADETKT